MSFIQRATLLLSALSSLAHVRAAPAPQHLELAKKYAPQFRFHKDEKYFPSTVDYFLAGPVSLYDDNGPLAGAPSSLTSDNLGRVVNQGTGMYLTTDVDANLNGFLQGQNPQKSQPSTYVFISPKKNGVVDLYYWTFSPYNLGKKLPAVGYVGNHVGDWERVTVRTVNGLPRSVDYHSHDGTGSGTLPWAQAPKFSPSSPNGPSDPHNPDPNARPVAYVAEGSHGVWASAGIFTFFNAIIFKLQDVTSDGGVYWDTQSSLTPINWPDLYSGSLDWLNYRGRWGNEGDNQCWWYELYPACELVTGPTGPLRPDVLNQPRRRRDVSQPLLEKLSARDLPSQVLATISSGNPSYTFNTDATSARFVSVQQICASVITGANGEPTRSYESSYTYTTAKAGTAQYTVEDVPACEGYSFISSYSIGLCTEKSKCSYGDRRDIRVYSEDPKVFGPQEVASVIVDDLDDWIL